MYLIIKIRKKINVEGFNIIYIYLFNVYKDSENDSSKIKFGFEEKKNFFKTMNKI